MVSTIQKLKRVDRLSAFDQVKYREAFMEYAGTLPIHRRLNNPELAFLLKRAFDEKKLPFPMNLGFTMQDWPPEYDQTITTKSAKDHNTQPLYLQMTKE